MLSRIVFSKRNGHNNILILNHSDILPLENGILNIKEWCVNSDINKLRHA